MHFSKGAVIVETRVIPNLFEIIQDGHMKYVPKDWGLTLFLSKENKHLIDREKFNRNVEIIILNYDNFSIADYNNLLTSQNFYECLDYDKILIFQTDSRILQNGIENFLNFDFIGACWAWRKGTGCNGGLSLRTKQKMLDVINHTPFNYVIHGNEDVYFSDLIESVGGKIASREDCMRFSVEAVYGLQSIGYHAINKYLTDEQCFKIINQYK